MAKLTKRAVMKAIDDSGGIISTVAKRLGKDWSTARRYINMWDETKAAFTAEVERVTDLAENRLIQQISEGERWAIKFWLTTKGKSRGFTQQMELAHSGGVSVNIHPAMTRAAPPQEDDQGDDSDDGPDA
jgi:hypothetical protein